jgi:hypothetical protein
MKKVTVLENDRLSANTLFNFTKKFEYLISKIENKFKPRLVWENYKPIGIKVKIAIPMVCFCDIRLSDISAHTAEYGDYGIGLTKEWGIENKLNPVMYITSENSYFVFLFKQLVKDIPKTTSEINKEIMNLCSFFKPYSGYQNKKFRNFYNEREWRYVPTNIDIDKYALVKEDFTQQQKEEENNEKLFKETNLDFLFEDIKYIILKEKSEKEEVANKIANTFNVSKIEIYRNICFITKEMIEKDL